MSDEPTIHGERLTYTFRPRQISTMDRVAARMCVARREALILAVEELDRDIGEEWNPLAKGPAFSITKLTTVLGEIARISESNARVVERLEAAIREHARSTLLADLCRVMGKENPDKP